MFSPLLIFCSSSSVCPSGLQSQGPLVFSGSADGGVWVWEVHPSQHHTPLHRLQDWGPSVTGCGGGAHLALSPRGDRVFMACGRASVRVLDWRTGESHTQTLGHRHLAAVLCSSRLVPRPVFSTTPYASQTGGMCAAQCVTASWCMRS